MSKEELIKLFEAFLNENGLWDTFEIWLDEKEELSPEDVGF